MKELSIEQKAKAYDEAKIRGSRLWESDTITREDYEYMFPEIEEDEDERIRKDVISFVEQAIDAGYGIISKERKEKWIAWLKKKGEQILANSCQTCKDEQKAEEEVDNLHNYLYGEQKPVDKVKPKFKDGDWVVVDNEVLHIKDVTDGEYITEEGGHIPFRYEKEARLWTIADAKDGDVLACVTDEGDLWIMIYWSLYEPYEGHVHYHALLVNNNFFDKGTCCICTDNLKPATKEQRDTLFSKMKEAGYEWDAENKELKKIEQKKEPTEFERGYRKAMEDTCKGLLIGFPEDVREYVKDFYTKDMEQKLKELSQG